MFFVSASFLIFFAAIYLARMTIGRTKTEPAYLIFLLLGSLLFYAWHVPIYLAILLTSTVVDYVAGGYLGRGTGTERQRRAVLVVSLVTNLGLLFYFKYANFLLDETAQMLSALGLESSAPTLQFVLPIGISFYTFQSMSYTIDIYRGVLRPVDSFWKLLLFVSFFPQLVAGPIVRARDFLYQIDRPRRLNLDAFYEGVYLVIRGFFLKMVVADNLGGVVDAHWFDASVEGGTAALAFWVTVLFSFQIFADFAGYSSIARGLAYLLGFRLPVNFNSPYIAASFREFWTRWHITLSQWLRDYVYVSLGGNRKGPRRTLVNLMLVMLLGGLWHGAANTFIIWGAIHGTALVLERLLGMHRPRGRFVTVLWYLVVQTVVLIAWIFFRAESAAQGWAILVNLFSFRLGTSAVSSYSGLLVLVMTPAILMHARSFLCERVGFRRPSALERSVYAAIMLYLTATAFGMSNEFIYFQF